MAYDTIQDDGTGLTQFSKSNFRAALAASNDAPNLRTNVNLAVTATNDVIGPAQRDGLGGVRRFRVLSLPVDASLTPHFFADRDELVVAKEAAPRAGKGKRVFLGRP